MYFRLLSTFFVNIILCQFDWYLRLEFEINQSALPRALLSWPAWDYWIFQYAYAGIFRKPKKVKRRKVKTKNEQKWLYKNTKIQKHAEIAEVTFDPPRSAIYVCLCKTIKSSKSNKFIVKLCRCVYPQTWRVGRTLEFALRPIMVQS